MWFNSFFTSGEFCHLLKISANSLDPDHDQQMLVLEDTLVVFMRGSRKFCQRGSNSGNIFFFDEGRTEDLYNTKSMPSSAHQRNTILTVFASDPMIAQQ